MKLFNYYVIILLLGMGCSPNRTEKELASNKTITDVFDKSEIKELAMIVDFFNAQICDAQKGEKTTITQCYQHFFNWMKACELSGNYDSIPYHVSYQEQQKMYSQLSEDVFDQIWRIDQRWYHDALDTTDTVEVIDITYNGKYLKFLKEFGKENGLIEEYADEFEQVGEIGPVGSSMVLNEYQLFDVNDIRFQLFIAMHYLTLNDAMEVRKQFKPNTSYMNYHVETLPKSVKEFKKKG